MRTTPLVSRVSRSGLSAATVPADMIGDTGANPPECSDVLACEHGYTQLRDLVRRAPTIALLGVALASGCQDGRGSLPDLEYETERVVVGVQPDRWKPLCAGDLRAIDRTVAAIESRVGFDREDPIEVYLMDSDEAPCRDGTRACYSPTNDQVYATWSTLPHELVHAIVRDMEFESLFWQEGVAEAVSGGPTWKDPRRALTPDDLQAESLVTYRSAAHFNRFIIETRGWEAYRRVVFESVSMEEALGSSNAAILGEYESSVPFAYPALDPCPFPTLPQTDDGGWSETLDLDCASDDATQFERVTSSSVDGGIGVVRRLELSAGTYAVELHGGVEVIALACAATELPEQSEPPTNGDLYSEYDFALGTPLESGSEHVLTLTDGTYRFSVTSGTQEASSATLMVRRISE